MLVKLDASKTKQVGWSQYAIRFALGGLITAVAGIIAEKFGPAVGGLFLAFPAIFPASITLIEKTEQSKKRGKWMRGEERGCAAAIVDSYGAALGSLALIGFAVLLWLSIQHHKPWIVLVLATGVWIGVALAAWAADRWRRHRHPSFRAGNREDRARITRIDQV
jgi:Protein of unknown function (DUF3147)